MKFTIIRVSDLSNKPCKEAKRATHLDKEDLLLEGRKAWIIEFNDLGSLLNFCILNGGMIIINTENKTPEIEIYDSFRE